MKSETSWSH